MNPGTGIAIESFNGLDKLALIQLDTSYFKMIQMNLPIDTNHITVFFES